MQGLQPLPDRSRRRCSREPQDRAPRWDADAVADQQLVARAISLPVSSRGRSSLMALDVAEACVFRRKPNTDSAASRTLIPLQAEHRFRSKPNSDSAGKPNTFRGLRRNR